MFIENLILLLAAIVAFGTVLAVLDLIVAMAAAWPARKNRSRE